MDWTKQSHYLSKKSSRDSERRDTQHIILII